MEITVKATIGFVFDIDVDETVTEQMAREHAVEMAREELCEYLNGTRMPLDDDDFTFTVE